MTRRTDVLQIRLEQTGDGRVKASLAGVGEGLDTVDKKVESVDKHAKLAEKSTASLGAALAALGGTVIAGQIINTITEFEGMNASLVTLTGSQANANAEMKELLTFTSTTPFQLQEVVTAFTKLKSLGLDPSIESLRSYGNTASAMGKDLNQFIEAVADAATGEFERLKEFGIKARQQGDDVAFTFQGVTTVVHKRAADIETYLKRIGDVQFAGAMDQQMQTLGGAISNMEDSVTILIATIGDAGLSGAIKEGAGLIRDFSTALKETISPSDDFDEKLQNMSESGRIFLSIFTGVKNLAEDLAKHNTGIDVGVLDMSKDQLIKRGAELEQQIALLRQQGVSGKDRAQLAALTGGTGPAFDAAMAAGTANEIKKLEDELKLVTATYQALQDRDPNSILKGAGDGAKDAAGDTENLNAAVGAYLGKLQQQLDVLGKTPGEIAAMVAASKGATEAQQQEAAALADSIEKRKEELKLMDAQEKAREKETEQLKKNVETLRESLLTDVEKEQEHYQNSLDLLRAAEEQKLSTTMSYANLRQRVEEDHQKALDEIEKQAAEEHKKQLGEMSEYGIQSARNMQSAWADYFFDPFDEGLGGMVSGFTDALRRMAANLAASEVMKFLTGDYGQTGELGGIAGDIVSWGSGILGLNNTSAAVGHDGGIGSEITARRMVPSATFDGAPRLHQGYDPSTEMPAIIRRDEGVFTPEQMKAMGGNVYYLNIDARGADAGVEQRLEAKFKQMAEQELLPQAVATATNNTIDALDRMGRSFA